MVGVPESVWPVRCRREFCKAERCSEWADPLRTFPAKFAVLDSPGQPMVVGRREARHLLTSSFLWRGERASKPVEAPECAIVRPGRLDFRGLPRLLHVVLGR